MRVLVTGAAGTIGKPVCEYLARRGHAIRRFDRVPSGGDDDVVADIADTAAVLTACADVEAIVHLAATPDQAPFLELVSPNVIGVFNLLDAARQQKVQRVVLASSVQVGWSQGPHELRAGSYAAPRNHYALTKLWAEEMGAMYTRLFPITVIAARIGWMVRDEQEAFGIRERCMLHNYVSRRDVCHFMACAIETTHVPFSVLYVIGPDGRECYDIDTARELIGYEPRDRFPEGLPFTFPPEQR